MGDAYKFTFQYHFIRNNTFVKQLYTRLIETQ